MAKLYFKYGAMGSSKTAQGLMCKFNYEQKGFKVMLIKSVVDSRDFIDGKVVVKSRIGLSSPCEVFDKKTDLYKYIQDRGFLNNQSVIIVDEAQFCTKKQIEELHVVSTVCPVLCYGLLTNFKTELFEGSKRLIEIAESISEIKSVCSCGKKATVNARFVDGKLVTEGEECVIGGDETYSSICFSCYEKLKNNTRNCRC